MLNTALLTSRSCEWTTPQDFFEALDLQFHFTLDPCATSENAKRKRYFTKADDGLAQPWTGRVFMNPPYGREIGKWVKKAYEESQSNAELVVCLLPARTDTRWWHDYCLKGQIVFVKGRLKFSSAKNSAPFPSAIVCFRPSVRSK
jgi:site-specific DNA-methyltransferase (adenine-specific)